MVSRSGKNFLENTIRQTNQRNRHVEEDMMWRAHSAQKSAKPQTALRMDSYRAPKSGRHGKGPSRKKHEMDSMVRKVRREGQSGNSRDNYWTKKLLQYEENDPDRWGHSGFKELYKSEFVGSDEERRRQRIKSHSHSPRLRSRSPKSRSRSPNWLQPDTGRRSNWSPERDPRSHRNEKNSSFGKGNENRKRPPSVGRGRIKHSDKNKRVSRDRNRTEKDHGLKQRTPSPRYSKSHDRNNKIGMGRRSPMQLKPKKRDMRPSDKERLYSPSSPSRRSTSVQSRGSRSRSISSTGSDLTRTSSSGSYSSFSRSYSRSRSRSRTSTPSVKIKSRVPKKTDHNSVHQKKTVGKTTPKTKSHLKNSQLLKPVEPRRVKKPPVIGATTKKTKPKTSLHNSPPIPAKLKKADVAKSVSKHSSSNRNSAIPLKHSSNTVEIPHKSQKHSVKSGKPSKEPEKKKKHKKRKNVTEKYPDHNNSYLGKDGTPRKTVGHTETESSSDNEPSPKKISLSERFGKLAQLGVDRHSTDGIRPGLRITRDMTSTDKKITLDNPGDIANSPSPIPSTSRYDRQSWERDYALYIRDHYELPRELPRNWDNVRVRYEYYRDMGYFRDYHNFSLEDYKKWEEWWYKYREWLEREGYYDRAREWELRDRLAQHGGFDQDQYPVYRERRSWSRERERVRVASRKKRRY